MADTAKRQRSDLEEAALYFHKHPTPGKLEIQATKPLGNQRDLALAYSPGVAAPCEEIAADPATAPIIPRAATSSPSSPTARPCSASAISARWRPSR
jgi:malic enzyme